MHSFDPLCVPSDLPGVDTATLNGMLLYCRLMTKWSGLGDSTELSRVGLSHLVNHLDPLLSGTVSLPSLLLGGG
jgi:hypothetical protein